MTDFQQVYETYFQDVYKYVLSLCRDPSLAEEVTQETFFKALKSMDSFRGQCKLYVWLCQIAKNTYFSLAAKHNAWAASNGGVAETRYYIGSPEDPHALLIWQEGMVLEPAPEALEAIYGIYG